MEPVFRFRPNQPVSWFSRSKARSNHYCLYCGVFVGPGSDIPSNKEHLIARRLVPPGKLKPTSFNFIFRACRECNRRKADAERHVSTITLLSSVGRIEDPAVDQIAEHKISRDYHPRMKGVLIKDAAVSQALAFRFGGAEITFQMSGPPQLHAPDAIVLAGNQIQGLFSLVTSKDPTQPALTRLLPAEQWRLLGWFPVQDWGNPHVRTVMDRVARWDILARIDVADGYFKAIMQRTKATSAEWFWALEWNRSIRVLGAIYAEDGIPPVLSDLPRLEWRTVPGNTLRLREEIPLEPADDTLFAE